MVIMKCTENSESPMKFSGQATRGGEWRICRVMEGRILLHPDSVVAHVVKIIRLISISLAAFQIRIWKAV
jgi:hypothetical protein